MSTVIIHADVQAHTVSEESVDVVNRDELSTILSSYTMAAPFVFVDTPSYTLQDTENIALVRVAATVTLPLASQNVNKVFNIKRLVRDGRVFINCSGTDSIDNKPSIELTSQYASLSLISDGTTWWIF